MESKTQIKETDLTASTCYYKNDYNLQHKKDFTREIALKAKQNAREY